METLWKGRYSELQIAETYCVGQFVRLKSDTFNPRFEWPRKRGGEWKTGRICQVLPNGCLVVRFPGRLTFGNENSSFLADPSEVQCVSFSTSPGVVKKYQHPEDFHWAVRPLLIALGLFTAMKLGLFVGKKISRSKIRKGRTNVIPGEAQSLEGHTAGNTGWLPPHPKWQTSSSGRVSVHLHLGSSHASVSLPKQVLPFPEKAPQICNLCLGNSKHNLAYICKNKSCIHDCCKYMFGGWNYCCLFFLLVLVHIS